MLSRLIQSEGRWIHALLVLSTITVALVLIGLLSNIVVYFSDILLILVMAWLFAFILSPLASWVERHMPVLPRVAVVAVIYGLLFVALAAIVVAIAVGVGGSFKSLIDDLPTIQANLPETLKEWQARLKDLGLTQVDLVAAVDQAIQGLRDLSGDLVKPAAELALASLGIIGNLLMVVFLSVFILIDKDKIMAFFLHLAPPRYADEVRLLQTSVSSSFGGFMRGQAIQGVVLGLVAAAGGFLLDIPYWPATAVIVAILQMIPFFGPFVSWAPPVVVAALTPGAPVVLMLIIMVVGWFVVMNIIQPRVMANSVGIHPVVVLVSVLIGLKLQGVVGAIFAVPVAAVISAFFFFYLQRSTDGGPRDVASRAAKRVEAREGRSVRVPTAPVVVPGSPADSASLSVAGGAGGAASAAVAPTSARGGITGVATRLMGRGSSTGAPTESPDDSSR
jgi:predicted PurR-regulated permease PerM